MQEVIKALLLPSEECTSFITANQLIIKGSQIRLIGLVENHECNTSSLFIFKIISNKSISLDIIVPITNQITVKLEQNLMDLSFFKVSLENTNLDSNLVLELIRTSATIQFISKLNSSIKSEGIKDFDWINKYKIQCKLLIPEKATQNVPLPTGNPFIQSNMMMVESGIREIKELWMAKELRGQKEQFCSYSDLKIFCGTWNVAGENPSESLRPWLGTLPGETPDIYILSFQEMDLSTEAFLVYDNSKEGIWSYEIEKALGVQEVPYTKVISKQLVGMLILIYSKVEHVEIISEITTASIGTGLLGMIGNKGAVGVRMRIRDSYFTFVNSHLAADQNMVDKRNLDFKDISEKLTFPTSPAYEDSLYYYYKNPWVSTFYDFLPAKNGGSFSPIGVMTPFGDKRVSKFLSVFDTDHLFWMGDLNYRIANMSEVMVKSHISQGNLRELLENDQLLNEKKAKRVFNGFDEARINFNPTYKYDIGTSVYDSSEKRRSPAWCDRVLWMKNPLKWTDRRWIQCTNYNSIPVMVSSDHKPVNATFIAQMRHLDKKKLDECITDLTRQLDKLENESLPILEFKENDCFFGNVEVLVPVSRSITFKNIGKVIADFTVQSADTKFIPPWYTITPNSGSIFPGELLTIDIQLLIKPEHVIHLNGKQNPLTYNSILNIKRGNDHFMTFSGDWLGTVFGENITFLCNILEPIQSLSFDKVKSIKDRLKGDTESIAISDDQPPIPNSSTPKELYRLLDFIYKHGMEVNDLFSGFSDPFVSEYIRKCIDSGEEFNTSLLFENIDCQNQDFSTDTSIESFTGETHHSLLPDVSHISKGKAVAVHSVVDTLILFLNSLSEPIIPFHIQEKCIADGYLGIGKAEEYIKDIPDSSLKTFIYLTRFFSQVCKEYQGKGIVDPESIASTFAPILLKVPVPPPPEVPIEKTSPTISDFYSVVSSVFYKPKAASPPTGAPPPPSVSQIVDTQIWNRKRCMFLIHFIKKE